MDFEYDEKTEQLRAKLLAFMDEFVYPAEKVFAAQLAELEAEGRIWERPPVIEDLKAEARSRGLWNLFLAHHPAGAGLTNLQYAPLAEITGRSPALAPEALNCAAPDTGNMELLAEFGSERAAGALAQAAAGRRDPVGVLHDRARCRVIGRHEHRHPDRAGRRRVRDQRPEVVVVRGDGPQLPDPHRDGQDQPGRRAAPPAVDDPGAVRHPRGEHPPRHARLRLHRRIPRRPRRDRVHRRAGARGQPDLRRGAGLRDRAGPARARPDPSLHAPDRCVRAGPGADVPAGAVRGPRSASRWPSRASSRTGSPSPGSGSSRPGCWC